MPSISIDLSKLDLKPIFEVRERYERRIDRDFHSPSADNRGDLFSRWRGGVSFQRGDVGGRVVYQYSHNLSWTPTRNKSAERSDVLEANLTLKTKQGTFTIGRQRFGAGNRKLLGELEWSNVANAFDGVAYAQGPLTLFAFKQGVIPAPSRNLFLGGIAHKCGSGLSMAILKSDRFRGVEKGRLTLSHENIHTIDSGTTLDYQLAGQVGHEGGKSVQAWAGYARATKSLDSKVDAFVESNIASGGRSADVVKTFDSLYPSGHDRLGLLDTTGWQNVIQFGVGLKFKLSKSQNLKVQFMDLRLYDPADAWYGVGGGVNAQAPASLEGKTAAGSHIGHEFDLDYGYQLSPRAKLSAGVGILAPGKFVKTLLGSTNQSWAYVMLSYRY
jgi:hypothetical protein